jgi:hypothetical protein
VKTTHVTSDVLTILALGAMELRRRRLEKGISSRLAAPAGYADVEKR